MSLQLVIAAASVASRTMPLPAAQQATGLQRCYSAACLGAWLCACRAGHLVSTLFERLGEIICTSYRLYIIESLDGKAWDAVVDVCVCCSALQGLEAAIEAAAAAEEADEAEEEDETAELRTSATAAVVTAGLQTLSAAAGTGTSSAGGAPSADTSAGGANGMPAQQAAAAGPSAAPGPLQTQSSVGPAGGMLYSQPSWQQQQQPYYHGRVSGGFSHAGRPGRHAQRLTTQEKDVLLVLTAFCKLASREVPGGTASSDSVLAQGKLLALEMLAKVR